MMMMMVWNLTWVVCLDATLSCSVLYYHFHFSPAVWYFKPAMPEMEPGQTNWPAVTRPDPIAHVAKNADLCLVK